MHFKTFMPLSLPQAQSPFPTTLQSTQTGFCLTPAMVQRLQPWQLLPWSHSSVIWGTASSLTGDKDSAAPAVALMGCAPQAPREEQSWLPTGCQLRTNRMAKCVSMQVLLSAAPAGDDARLLVKRSWQPKCAGLKEDMGFANSLTRNFTSEPHYSNDCARHAGEANTAQPKRLTSEGPPIIFSPWLVQRGGA